MTLKTVFRLLPILLLAACAQHGSMTTDRQVMVAPGIVMTLPSITEFDQSIEALQMATATYKDQVITFQNRISLSPHHGLIVGLDPMGRQALTITLTPQGIAYEKAPWLPVQLRPENVLADIMITNWPAASVQRALGGSGATLIVTKNSRSIVKNGKEVLRADFTPDKAGRLWFGKMHYVNRPWGYKLDIQSVEQ